MSLVGPARIARITRELLKKFAGAFRMYQDMVPWRPVEPVEALDRRSCSEISGISVEPGNLWTWQGF